MLEQEIGQAIARIRFQECQAAFQDRGQTLFLEDFLPAAVVEAILLPEVERLRPRAHRSFIPRHKKSGSISFYTLAKDAPVFLTLYRSRPLRDFLSRLAGVPLLLCPEDDPHSCALYYYTKPGDHIGFHYDTSYYKGARYTALLGLVQRSNSRLVCQLHKNEPGRQVQELELATPPGAFVFFNGDKLYHAVTPLGRDEQRVVLTMEYVTNPQMNAFHRAFSNLKDAFAYFGLSTLFRRPPERHLMRR
ncbi:MAG: 2OG-Fe(II) oxygenase [Planctomycetes bacterium]|nr:2OG-Fe(II) oxygenase [Planctomycetota bacterium]